MFAAGKTAAVSGAGPDDKFNYVTMLLHGDGTNGAQNNTFLDSGPNTFSITRNGNVTQGSFSPYGSNWSNFFDGNGTYLSVPSDAVFQFGTGDFTIECWFYDTGTVDQYPAIISSANGWQSGSTALRFNNTGLPAKFSFHHNPTGDPIFSSTNTFASYQWHHVAVTRSGTSMKMFVNGVQEASATVSASISLDTTTGVYIGSGFDTGSKIKGYVSNVRVVKGTAVYTSAFTPSTTALTAISGTSLLTCQSNRFKDNSAQNFTLTIFGTATSVQRFNPFGASTAYSTSVIGGSGYFDGSGDSLTTASNANFGFGTGDFTVECWAYPLASTAQRLVFFDNDINNLDIGFSPANTFQYYNGSVNNTGISAASRQWFHFVASRTSGTTSVYINGVRTNNITDSTDTTTRAVQIGNSPSSNPFNGYISDVRIIKGTGIYSGTTITVPTSPLTAITNTKLLLNFTNGAIFDNAMMNNLETVGNAQISTSVVKYGTGSIALDGTGDYLSTRGTPNLAFGSGDFTIECWAYATSLGSYNALFAQWPDNGGTANNSYVLEAVGSPDYMYFYWATSAGLQGPATLGTITTGVWIHWAICRSGNTLYPFKNGVLGTTTSITQTLNSPTSAVTVGGAVAGGGEWNGYIDDLRITKGYARYTSNFTPPTEAFPNNGPY